MRKAKGRWQCVPTLNRVQGVTLYEDLPEPEDTKSLLSQTAMLKLNGGLGTSMGLEKAKSLLVVKDGKTFLDLIAEQARPCHS